MKYSGGRLVRMLDDAYLDWSWGAKRAAFRTIFKIIQQLEGHNGKAAEPTYQIEARKASVTAPETHEARRQRLRDDFEARFLRAEANQPKDEHLF